MEPTYDVLIAGLGPVGQTAATLLAQGGHRVAAFERHDDLFPYSRAGFADHEVMRIFQSLGCVDAITKDTIVLRTYEWRSPEGDLLLPLRFPDGPSSWDSGHGFFQPYLESVLSGAATDAGAELNRGSEVVGVSTHGDRVDLEVRRNGHAETVSGRFLLGADGANSFVRDAIGAKVVDLGFRYPWIVVDLEPLRELPFKPIVTQVCDPKRPTTLGPLGAKHRRFEFMLLPGEDPDVMSSEEVVWDLLSPWVTPEDVRLLRHPVYTFEAKYVESWRHGRVLLAGDAAHLMPPFLGQGMNSGIRDIKNLTWKLDLVLRGIAPEDILDTYTAERQPQAKYIIEESVELGKYMCITDPDAAAERDKQLLEQAAVAGPNQEIPAPSVPPLSGDLIASGEPLAGTLSVQGRVERDGKEGRFDDVVGRGFVLLAREADPATVLDEQQLSFLAEIGTTIAHFGTGGSFDDVNGTYEAWFAEQKQEAVLIRPDFYVYGAARKLTDVPALVDRLRNRLVRPTS